MNIEEAGMAQGIRDAGRHLGYVHMSESNRGVPGRGTINWADTFKGLKEIGFNGPLTVESFVFVAPRDCSRPCRMAPGSRTRGGCDRGRPAVPSGTSKAGGLCAFGYLTRAPRFDLLFKPLRIGLGSATNRLWKVRHCIWAGFTMPFLLATMSAPRIGP